MAFCQTSAKTARIQNDTYFSTAINHKKIEYPSYIPANDKFVAFHESLARIRAIFGANRSGKTEAGAFELITLCRKHPGVEVWASTVSYDAIREYVWPKIKKYLHSAEIAMTTWAKKAENVPHIVYLQNGSFIVFKSYDQGREKFQGASVFAIWLDEECNEDIYNECLPRILDCGGYLFLTMTPLKGLSWPYTRIQQETENPNIQSWTVSLWENPYISEEDKQVLVSIYSEDEKPKRVSGLFTLPTGAVWKELKEDVHFIPRFPIPREWRRIRSIDLGYDNPFCCLWLAENPQKEIFVYQEYYKRATLLKDHAQAIQGRDTWGLTKDGQDRGIEVTVCDHERQERAELESYGIHTRPASKTVALGIQVVNRTFKAKALFVFDDLTHTKQESRMYHYKPGTELPEKKNDHTQDPMRYGVVYFRPYDITCPLFETAPSQPTPSQKYRSIA